MSECYLQITACRSGLFDLHKHVSLIRPWRPGARGLQLTILQICSKSGIIDQERRAETMRWESVLVDELRLSLEHECRTCLQTVSQSDLSTTTQSLKKRCEAEKSDYNCIPKLLIAACILTWYSTAAASLSRPRYLVAARHLTRYESLSMSFVEGRPHMPVVVKLRSKTIVFPRNTGKGQTF